MTLIQPRSGGLRHLLHLPRHTGPFQARPVAGQGPVSTTTAKPLHPHARLATAATPAALQRALGLTPTTFMTKASLKAKHGKPSSENFYRSGRIMCRVYGNPSSEFARRIYSALTEMMEKEGQPQLKSPLKLNAVTAYFLRHSVEILNHAPKAGANIVFHISPSGEMAIPHWNTKGEPAFFTEDASWGTIPEPDTRIENLAITPAIRTKIAEAGITTIRQLIRQGRERIKVILEGSQKSTKTLETDLGRLGYYWDKPLSPKPMRLVPEGHRNVLFSKISTNEALLRAQAKSDKSLSPIITLLTNAKAAILPKEDFNETPFVTQYRDRAALHLDLVVNSDRFLKDKEETKKILSLIYREANIVTSARVVEEQVDNFLEGLPVLDIPMQSTEEAFSDPEERRKAEEYQSKVAAKAASTQAGSQEKRDETQTQQKSFEAQKERLLNQLGQISVLTKEAKDLFREYLENSLKLLGKKGSPNAQEKRVELISKRLNHIESLFDFVIYYQMKISQNVRFKKILNDGVLKTLRQQKQTDDFTELTSLVETLRREMKLTEDHQPSPTRQNEPDLSQLSDDAKEGFRLLLEAKGTRRVHSIQPELLLKNKYLNQQPQIRNEIFALVRDLKRARVQGVERLFMFEEKGFLTEKPEMISGSLWELKLALRYARDTKINEVSLAKPRNMHWELLTEKERKTTREYNASHYLKYRGDSPYSETGVADIEYVTDDGVRVLVETKSRRGSFSPQTKADKASYHFQILRYAAMIRDLTKDGKPVEFHYVVHSSAPIDPTFETELKKYLTDTGITCRLIRIDSTSDEEHELLHSARSEATLSPTSAPTARPSDPPRAPTKRKQATLADTYSKEAISLAERWLGQDINASIPASQAYTSLRKALSGTATSNPRLKPEIKNRIDLSISGQLRRSDTEISRLYNEMTRVLNSKKGYPHNFVTNILKLAKRYQILK